ncbi:MAG: hypothetical protein U0176_03005 [Bacteroidia bacterium]
MRSFTFNHPAYLLFTLPLMVLVTMFVWGLTVEFRVSLLFMLLATLSLVGLLVYFSLFRRMRIGSKSVEWVTPFKRHQMSLDELKHFGVVKFRRFRFAYVSKAEEDPFADPQAPVVSDENTFVVQYRKSVWEALQSLMRNHHPAVQPQSITRQ